MEIVYMQIAMVLSLIVKCLHGSLSTTLQGKWLVFVSIHSNFVRKSIEELRLGRRVSST